MGQTLNPNWQLGGFRRGNGPWIIVSGSGTDGAFTTDGIRAEAGGAGGTFRVNRDTSARVWKPPGGICLTIDQVGIGTSPMRLFWEESDTNPNKLIPTCMMSMVWCDTPNAVRLSTYDGTTPGTTKPANTGGNGNRAILGVGQTGTNRAFMTFADVSGNPQYHPGDSQWHRAVLNGMQFPRSTTVEYYEWWIEQNCQMSIDSSPIHYGLTAIDLTTQNVDGDPHIEFIKNQMRYKRVALKGAYLASGATDVRQLQIPFSSPFLGGAVITSNLVSNTGLYGDVNCTIGGVAVVNTGADGLHGEYTVTPGVAGTASWNELWEFVTGWG